MSTNTVGELLDKLPPVEGEARTARIDAPKANRRSLTVRKIGAELNRAVEIRQMLQEHADDPQLILDMIEGGSDLPEACVAVYEEICEDEILLAGLTAQIAELQTRKGRIEKSIEGRRNIILMAMDKAGLGTIRSPLATLSIRDVPPKVVITDEAQIPSRFWKAVDPKLDKAAVTAALKAGDDVPGATMGNGGIGLSVRVL
jgi:hypothetical protein